MLGCFSLLFFQVCLLALFIELAILSCLSLSSYADIGLNSFPLLLFFFKEFLVLFGLTLLFLDNFVARISCSRYWGYVRRLWISIWNFNLRLDFFHILFLGKDTEFFFNSFFLFLANIIAKALHRHSRMRVRSEGFWIASVISIYIVFYSKSLLENVFEGCLGLAIDFQKSIKHVSFFARTSTILQGAPRYLSVKGCFTEALLFNAGNYIWELLVIALNLTINSPGCEGTLFHFSEIKQFSVKCIIFATVVYHAHAGALFAFRCASSSVW